MEIRFPLALLKYESKDIVIIIGQCQVEGLSFRASRFLASNPNELLFRASGN